MKGYITNIEKDARENKNFRLTNFIKASRKKMVTAFTRMEPNPKVKRRMGPKAKRTIGFIRRLIKERAATAMANPSIV